MLKIAVSNTDPGTIFVLSGRLAGPWVDEVRDCWLKQKKHESAPCHVDLREVTFIDEAGTSLLFQMSREGVTIQASGCLTRAIVQSLDKTGVRNHE
jgi:ABC-type transporter Mla MlaB component